MRRLRKPAGSGSSSSNSSSSGAAGGGGGKSVGITRSRRSEESAENAGELDASSSSVSDVGGTGLCNETDAKSTPKPSPAKRETVTNSTRATSGRSAASTNSSHTRKRTSSRNNPEPTPMETATASTSSTSSTAGSSSPESLINGGKRGPAVVAVIGAAPTTLSAEVFKHFEKSGRSEFLKFIKQQLRDSKDNGLYHGANGSQLNYGVSGALYDLLKHGVHSLLRKEVVLQTLNEVVGLHEEFPSLILDLINVLDAETTSTTADHRTQDHRNSFCQLLCDLDKVIPEEFIKERLEIDTLQEVGIVKNKMFYTKFIKIKTKLYYKQRRFNLFREESEGYAKLITELNQEFEDHVTSDSFMDIIKSLIGCFNLDPNRVLDIILESFETRPERWQLFIPLLKAYMPNGSIICEVLGYKFKYFADTKTPKSLYHVCSLLLKHNVIDLDGIYVWLKPTDRSIAVDWEQELLEAKEFVRKLNIILTNKDKESTNEVPMEKEFSYDNYYQNQKFCLCESLLKVGDWENAQKIIKKLPEQSVVSNEPITSVLIDLVHLCIDHIYRIKCFKILMYNNNSSINSNNHSNNDSSGSSSGIITNNSTANNNNSLTRNAHNNSQSFVRRRLADDSKLMQKLQVNDYKELRCHVIPMIVALGPTLHCDTVLMYKLIRIMRSILQDINIDGQNMPHPNTSEDILFHEVMTILDSAILPALSFLDCNCPISEEIWTVVRQFPYHYRYALYGRWKNETYLLHPQLIIRRGNAQKHIKAIMKRVSKENVKPLGRQIGKLSHCAPGFLFDYMLLQIQIYDNLIGPVVDSLKYLTLLSFDCLGYCLIEALTMADRDRFKHDGTSISLWLQSLASFCGAIFKKYNIELSGLLQYVANQLKSQKSLDLLILKDIVQKMAGVETVEEMTNEQLNALCGGELLRGEAGYFSQVRNTKKSSQRLKEALANNDLAVTICLLMAQQKHCVIYRETAQSHLKLVGKLYDQCQDTLVQFGTFLGSTYSVDEYVERLPSIIAMLQEYHIHADVAFFLARPMFTHQINQKYDQLRKSDGSAKKLTNVQKLQKYLDAANLIMNPIVESVRPLHSAKVWEDISPQFFVTFWSLSMYDLQVPAESYQREISKLKVLTQQTIEFKDSNASKNKKEQERYLALMDKLQDERKKQQEHVDKVLQRLQQQKDHWFLSRSPKSAKNETITQFLQLCLFPRCTFTALDALYCAKFVLTIHNLKAANFSTLLCYDRIFCDITYSVTSCTENEAVRYGRFLCAMLETVMRWHSDQNIFNRECANYPGFVTKFRVSNQFSEANDHVGYENYRHVCHKWHYKITKAVVFCLDSKEYMQIRNALIILMRILPHYPVLNKLAQIIERKVEKVREEEKNKRPDLFVIASSYIGQLKTKASQMIKENDFHQVAERPIKAATTTEATAADGSIAGGVNTNPGQQADLATSAHGTTGSSMVRGGVASSLTTTSTSTTTSTTTSTSTSTGFNSTLSASSIDTITSATLSPTTNSSHSNTAISTSVLSVSSSSVAGGNASMANSSVATGRGGTGTSAVSGSSSGGVAISASKSSSSNADDGTNSNYSHSSILHTNSSGTSSHTNKENGNSTKQIVNEELKMEKRERERSERSSKIIKLNAEREGLLMNTHTSNLNNRTSITVIEIKDDGATQLSERNDYEQRLSSGISGRSGASSLLESSSRSSLKETVYKKDESSSQRQAARERERELRERERERDHRSLQQQQQPIHIIDDSGDGCETRSMKREKRREERYRNDSPAIDITAFDGLINKLGYERDSRGGTGDYERSERTRDLERDRDRDRDRDLSSVSNDSSCSVHHQRRSQEIVEYERDTKRRKVESSSSSSSKKQMLIDDIELIKTKDRSMKNKERKEKLTDEEKDARRERKLGRKRERIEENSSSEHKRRRDVQNGDDELRDRSEKYHSLRDNKSPHLRDGHDRSHEKYERERGSREERTKSSRSRIGY